MIEYIDMISIWLGRILFIIGCTALIMIIIQWMINKLAEYDIYFKALVYHFLSEKKDVPGDSKKKVDIRLGRKWCVKFKGKWITWEIVKIEEQ